MKKLPIDRVLQISTVLAIALFYFCSLSSTVQEGDTGELVANAWRLGVPHPPGYPLYTWLYFAFLHLLPFGTVFWRASLLTSLLATGSLALLVISTGVGWLGFLFATSVATSYVFWRLAVLPDVFMLNAFLVSVIAFFYTWSLKAPGQTSSGVSPAALGPETEHGLRLREERRQKTWAYGAVFVWALSFANHLTILFLLPLILHLWLRHRSERAFYLAGLAGAVIAGGLYLSILALPAANSASWGHVVDLASLRDHMLRREYGTLQLSQSGVEGTWLMNLGEIFRILSSDLGALLLGFLALGFIMSKTRPLRVSGTMPAMFGLLISAVLYILVFFKLGNLPPQGFNTVVVDRFYLQSFVLLAFSLAAGVRELVPPRAFASLARRGLVVALAGGFIYLNVLCYWDANARGSSTIIEDHAMNLLRMAERKKAVIFTQSDTELFALHYVKDVLDFESSVFAIDPTSLWKEWERARLRAAVAGVELPSLIMPFHEKPQAESLKEKPQAESLKEKPQAESLKEKPQAGPLIEVALAAVTKIQPVLVTSGYLKYPYRVTYMGLGRVLSPGSGVEFDDGSKALLKRREIAKEAPLPPPWREDIAMYSQYGFLDFAHAQEDGRAGRIKEAKAALDRVLLEVPFYLPAYEKLCAVEKVRGAPVEPCLANLEAMKKVSADAYTYF